MGQDKDQRQALLAPAQIELNRADLLLLGANLEGLADRLLAENEENKPLVQALWHLEAAIEKVDADAFREDYDKLLATAGALYRGYFDVN